jgi:hypothetical protein
VIKGCNRTVITTTNIELCYFHARQWRNGTLDVGEKSSFIGLGRLSCAICSLPLVRHRVGRRCPFIEDALRAGGVKL